MKCVMCKSGETLPGMTTQTLQRGESLVVVKDVPAHICQQCGEDYLDETISQQLFELAEVAVAHGAELEIRSFAA